MAPNNQRNAARAAESVAVMASAHEREPKASVRWLEMLFESQRL
jgi:hypothetical protein